VNTLQKVTSWQTCNAAGDHDLAALVGELAASLSDGEQRARARGVDGV